MKTHKESASITQPVIWVGVDRQEAKGFHKVVLISESQDGLNESEIHFEGEVSVQMVNGELRVFVTKTSSPSGT